MMTPSSADPLPEKDIKKRPLAGGNPGAPGREAEEVPVDEISQALMMRTASNPAFLAPSIATQPTGTVMVRPRSRVLAM